MRYHIVHRTTYRYSQPVELEPHVVRLRPRSDLSQTLHAFQLGVDPPATHTTQQVDLDGNNLLHLRFEGATDRLTITATSTVETHWPNPFVYILEPWATHLPIDYPSALLTQLQPYLTSLTPGHNSPDPAAIQLAYEVAHANDNNVVALLSDLNQRIYKDCEHQIRETGAPFPPGLTWQQKVGSCRDFAVLFMAVCRQLGLASRFVSGYQEGDPNPDDASAAKPDRHLHAWVEVYLPGAGWRGYDPTHGLAVAAGHVALVASPYPHLCAPISGRFRGPGVKAEMSYELGIDHRH
ncbi:transglutaminase family protein [Trichothermofontia sp.]